MDDVPDDDVPVIILAPENSEASVKKCLGYGKSLYGDNLKK